MNVPKHCHQSLTGNKSHCMALNSYTYCSVDALVEIILNFSIMLQNSTCTIQLTLMMDIHLEGRRCVFRVMKAHNRCVFVNLVCQFVTQYYDYPR